MIDDTKGGGLPTAANDATHPDLFGDPAPGAGHVGPATRSTDPATSHAAARRAADRLTNKQLAVLDTFQRGKRNTTDTSAAVMTHEQLVEKYNTIRRRVTSCGWFPPLTDSSIRTRCKELVTLGYVQHVDDAGRTAAGGAAARWAITPAGNNIDVTTKRTDNVAAKARGVLGR